MVAVPAVAAAIGTKVAYGTASLVVFSTSMGWFVLIGIDWVRLATF